MENNFKLMGEFYPSYLNDNKLRMDRFPNNFFKGRNNAIYLLVFDEEVIKVGLTTRFKGRLSDYRNAGGLSCFRLTPILNKMMKDAVKNIQIYAKFYDMSVDSEINGEKIELVPCLPPLERKYKEIYKDTLLFV